MSTPGPRRRALIAAIPVAVGLAACTSSPKREPATLRFFTAHQAAVVEAATARIAPGPHDDPAEAGHPGAREAGVTGYIDTMLASLQDDKVFAGGPWSNRHTSGPNLMARFAPLDPVAKIAWRKRLTGWQAQYRLGIEQLDKLAGGDFTEKDPRRAGQDPGRPIGERVHEPAVRAHHRGPVRQPRIRRQPGPGRLAGDRLPGRHPAARLHRRRGRAVRRPRSGR